MLKVGDSVFVRVKGKKDEWPSTTQKMYTYERENILCTVVSVSCDRLYPNVYVLDVDSDIVFLEKWLEKTGKRIVNTGGNL